MLEPVHTKREGARRPDLTHPHDGAGQPSGNETEALPRPLRLSNHRRMNRVSALLLVACTALCCQKKSPGEQAAPEASSVGAPKAAPQEKKRPVVSAEEIQRQTNPGNKQPYSGPTGAVAGVVRVKGASSPPLELGNSKIPLGKCYEAHSMYQSLFREGPNRGLADVLVAVTGYEGYLPVPRETPTVVAKGCAFDRRTLPLMFGQTLKVKNEGDEAATPQLLGTRTQALLIAVPGGDPIELYPRKVGLHRLVDRSHEFAFVDVYVVSYPTTDVTGLDGRFEISGVPVGDVKLNALLPATGDTVERAVTVEVGKTVEVIVEIELDEKKLERQQLADEGTGGSATE